MDCIERIVYINLDHRTDRREHTEHELNHLGVTNYTRFSAIRTPSPALGCALSHYHVVKQAALDQVSSLLVLEDDFDVLVDKETLNARIQTFMTQCPDYDVVMFDYNLVTSEPVTEGIARVLEARTATAYLVAGHYLTTLANCYEEACRAFTYEPWAHWLYANDIVWKVLQPKDKWYCFLPRLMYQHGGYSDLSQRMIEHHTYASSCSTASGAQRQGAGT